MTDVTLRDFMDGVTLAYTHKKKVHEVAYRTGVGVFVDDEPDPVETDDVGARRVYWNLTGGKDAE